MSKNDKFLGIDLEALIQESVRGLFEVQQDESTENMKEKLKQQEKAKTSAERKKKMKQNPEEKSGNEGEEFKKSAPVKLKHEKIPEINIQAVIDKLNAIRSGKSLKDKETKEALKSYFQRLNGPERIALFAFLSGLDKVLGDAAQNVKTPHSDPFNVDMEKQPESEQQVQPKGSKKPSKSKSSDTPIVVGERANISYIKEKLWK
jgi:hypothetical protein